MRGHVRERGKGNWYAVVSSQDQTGKRKVKFISLPDAKGKREAQQALARIVTELNAGTFVEPDKVTVAAFLQRWLAPRTGVRVAHYSIQSCYPGEVAQSPAQGDEDYRHRGHGQDARCGTADIYTHSGSTRRSLRYASWRNLCPPLAQC